MIPAQFSVCGGGRGMIHYSNECTNIYSQTGDYDKV